MLPLLLCLFFVLPAQHAQPVGKEKTIQEKSFIESNKAMLGQHRRVSHG
jgi:hypothetical protein